MKNKWIKRLIILFVAIVLSIGVQTGVLFFVRSHYLDSNLDVQFKDIASNTSKSEEVKVTIPANIDYMIPSNNGKYLLYVLGEEAHVVNIEDGSDVNLDTTVDGDNTYFYWHDSEEKLIIAKTNEDGATGLTMYNYNPKVGEVQRALDYENKPRVYNVGSYEQRIKDIKINNTTTNLYLKLATEYRSNIYRVDISYGAQKIQLMSNNIGNYFILKQLDSIIYEEENSGKVYISDKTASKEIKIDGENDIKLLGLDNNLLYVEAMEGELVKSIYSIDLIDGYDSETATWDKIDLEKATKPEDIYLSRVGELYLNDNLSGKILNLKTKKKTKYEGKLIGIYKDMVISQEGTTVYRKVVK